MPLQHIHLPSLFPSYPTYATVVRLQSLFQQRLHAYKAALSSSSTESQPAPEPVLLSFTPTPTYTLGRRQTGPLSSAETARLSAPLEVQSRDRETGKKTLHVFTPAIHNAPRGGLATYHGPGQVVFWPIIDLRSPLHRHLTVRDYAHLLEQTTIGALARLTDGKVEGFTTENPGVWVRHDPVGRWNRAFLGDEQPPEGRDPAEMPEMKEERKIAALGVHLRRHVTGLGVAVNISMPVTGPEPSNPWGRIVACGLEDKRVTSLGLELWREQHGQGDWVARAAEEALPGLWARMFAEQLYDGGNGSRGSQKQLVQEADLSQLLGPCWRDELDNGVDMVS